MTNAQDRIAKLGIIGLAGIAILGWVRQPEMHTRPQSAERAVFQSPQRTSDPGEGRVNVRPTPVPDPEPVVPAEPPARRPKRSKGLSLQNQSVVIGPASHQPVLETERAESSRHELPVPQPQAEQTRSREPENEAASQAATLPTREPEPAPQARPPGQVKDTVANRAPQHPNVQGTKRSGTRSVAIIAGAAAAGAAIGAIAGHGKGAAIGAAAGAASGYVYDRTSRRKNPNLSGNPNDEDQANDQSISRPPLGATRIGTPYFN
jgi:hypothetical protein